MKEDMQRLQEIAKEWMEIASSPAMEERKRLWKACRDLKSERPMIRFDAYFLEGYIAEEQLVCQDTQLRDIEKMMLGMIGVTPMWDKFEAEMRDTYQATNGGKNLEIIFGDLYDINKEWGRLTEAVKLTYRILKL